MSLRSDAEAVRNLLAGGNTRFHLIHQFNIHPAAYAHPSWFAEIEPNLLRCLVNTRRGISRLSAMLLKQYDLDGDTCYDFEYPWWRFALLPADVLSKLTRYCGLVSLHRQIASFVDKRALRRIKESLGEQDYVFAVKRVPLLAGRKHGADLRWNGRFDIGRLARQYGRAYFFSHFSGAPRAITGRLAFKFPPSRYERTLFKAPQVNGWQLFKRILIHEIEPRWQPLFS